MIPVDRDMKTVFILMTLLILVSLLFFRSRISQMYDSKPDRHLKVKAMDNYHIHLTIVISHKKALAALDKNLASFFATKLGGAVVLL